MPYAPKRLEPSQPRKRVERRGNAHQRGYTRQWSKLADDHRKQWPLCVHCLREGRMNAGNPPRNTNHVDHIIRPPTPDHPLFNDTRNHQTLCRTHHKQKTEAEDAGRYNASRDQQERLEAIASRRKTRREGG